MDRWTWQVREEQMDRWTWQVREEQMDMDMCCCESKKDGDSSLWARSASPGGPELGWSSTQVQDVP